MQFCLDKEPKCPVNGQLLDVISSTESTDFNTMMGATF